MKPKPKLTIELIPKSAWNINARSILSPEQWSAVKKFIFAKTDYHCEICGGQGPKWPVECHEVFHYNMRTEKQTLIQLIALCPDCHETKHIGTANRRKRLEEAVDRLQKINNWTDFQVEEYIIKVIKLNSKRGLIQWKLDLTYLNQFGFKLEKP